VCRAGSGGAAGIGEDFADEMSRGVCEHRVHVLAQL